MKVSLPRSHVGQVCTYFSDTPSLLKTFCDFYDRWMKVYKSKGVWIFWPHLVFWFPDNIYSQLDWWPWYSLYIHKNICCYFFLLLQSLSKEYLLSSNILKECDTVSKGEQQYVFSSPCIIEVPIKLTNIMSLKRKTHGICLGIW